MQKTVFGYLRVSTKEQDLDKDKAEILLKANKLNLPMTIEWVEEHKSGTIHFNKRALGEILKKAKEGDVIITTELSRIGRKGLEVSEFISICAQKKIHIYLTRADFVIDNSINSQAMIFAYSISAQIERELLVERTKAGLNKARQNGQILGRKRGIMILDKNPNNINKVKELLDTNVKLYAIAEQMNCTPMTLNKFIKHHNLKAKK